MNSGLRLTYDNIFTGLAKTESVIALVSHAPLGIRSALEDRNKEARGTPRGR